MKEITSWLVDIEDAARGFYEKAAILFEDDYGLSALLRHLADDEKTHHEIVKEALAVVTASGIDESLITLDNDARQALEGRFVHYGRRLNAGALTKRELMEAIVEIEYSELNETFLYVLNALKDLPAEFFSAAANIHQHRRYIEWFMKSRPEFNCFFEKIKALPDLGGKPILAVDDERAMLNVFNIVLSSVGDVESASNGEEALSKLEAKRYAAVITDVDMPVMNGIELYHKAVERHPYLKGRFIFLSGSYEPERHAFLEANKLRVIMKPVSIKDIRKAVEEVMKRLH